MKKGFEPPYNIGDYKTIKNSFIRISISCLGSPFIELSIAAFSPLG